MTKADAELRERFSRLDIDFSWHEHEPVFTVEESAHLHGTIAGAHTKNLFLKDAGGVFWLVTMPHDATVDLKALPATIGAKKVSLGKAEPLNDLLGVIPGSVTPLAAMNDRDCMVHVVIDARLAAHPCVNIHPLRNSATVGISGADLLRFLRDTGHEALIAEIPAR